LPGEEVTYSLNIPLLAVAVTIIGITITALFQVSGIKRDRKKEQEHQEERSEKDREKMANTIDTTMKESLIRAREHFDDKIELLNKDIREDKEEIISLKKGLEKLTFEVLEIIKQGSAGAKARMDAIEQRLKSIEDRLK